MANYTRINLDTLIDRLSERVGNNTVYWTAVEKKRAINEAIRVWGVMAAPWSRRFTIPTVAGQIFYDVPKQIVSLQRVKYNTTVLYETSLPELDYGVSNWQQAAVSTPSLWAPIGLDKVAIYPPAPAGSFLNLEGLALAPALNAGGDFIDIGDEDINRILDYAHHVLSFKEGGLEFEATMPLLSTFVSATVQRNSRLGAASVFRKYLGMDRAQEQRPVRDPTITTPGARG